ncbi:MAG: IspD/TarI family cytidylyltransferase [Lentisphaeria bacterium]|jgi:2-C-methyl-D-erythritol 4-phosphate cytidylyltransferase
MDARMTPRADSPSHPRPVPPRQLPDFGLVLAGGGSGSRFGAAGNKLLLEWRGLAVFCHPLRTFLPFLAPAHVVVTAPPALLAEFRAALAAAGLPVAIRVLPGGVTRLDSVAAGVAALPPAVRHVAVQDGARPLTSAELFLACAESARRHGSGVAARPVTDTIKVADAAGLVLATPDRASLWAAETPQVFRRDWLEDGLRSARARGVAATDDAQAVELAGHPVRLVRATAANPKITWPDDLERLLPA